MRASAPLPVAVFLLGSSGTAGSQAAPAAAPAPGDHHHHHHHHPGPGAPAAAEGAHGHDLGPAGASYDLRFLDAMVQHRTGALRMSELE